MAKGSKSGRSKDRDDANSPDKPGTEGAPESSSKRGRKKNDSSAKPAKSGKGDAGGGKPAKSGGKPKAKSGKGGGKGGGKTAKPNVFQRLVAYFKGVRSEMRKVVWPDREEVVNSSIIVIVTIVFFTLFVLIVDQISSFVIIDQLATLGQ